MASSGPFNQSLSTALQRSEPLADLMKRLRESQARLAIASALLPPALRAGVQSGSLDDEGWVLLAANAAVAAKLRQWLPDLQSALLAAGHDARPIKIKVGSST